MRAVLETAFRLVLKGRQLCLQGLLVVLIKSEQMYSEVLRTLDKDPLASLTAPAVLASEGVIPLTIISVIPDIIQHHADLYAVA